MKLLTTTAEKCNAVGFGVDERLLIKCLVAVATDQNKFKNVGKININKLKGCWEQTEQGLDFAIRFLRDNAMIETTDVLPSLFLIVPVVRLAVKNDYALPHDLQNKVLRWLYAALIWGRYSRGSTETMLDKDLAAIRDSRDPLADMIKLVHGQAGRIKVTAEDLKGKTKQSPLFSMMYIAAKKHDAVDWGTGSGLGIGAERGFKSLHAKIFPTEAILSNLEHTRGRKEALGLANDIANTAFHSYRIRDKTPDKYLPDIAKEMGTVALTAQCIPPDPSLWTVDRYEDFLAVRRKMLASRINELLRWPPPPRSPRECLDAINAGETSTVEFKSSMLYDCTTGQKNPALKESLLKAIVAFMNTDGGIIYVGVTDKGEIQGIEPDYKLIEKHPNWDGWSQMLSNMINGKIKMPAPFSYVSYDRVSLNDTLGHPRDIAKITVLKTQTPAWIDMGGSQTLVTRQGTASRPLDPMDTAAYVPRHFPNWNR